MTIATPHLGVFHYNVLDTYNIQFPGITTLKNTIADMMSLSVQQLMASDNSSLIYKMATEDEFLIPLSRFHERRLYANLKRDFVVPLGTAAFLSKTQVQLLRKKYYKQSGFVYQINTTNSYKLTNPIITTTTIATSIPQTTTLWSSSTTNIVCNENMHHDNTCVNNNNENTPLLSKSLPLPSVSSSLPSSSIANEGYLIKMMTSLDSLGWEKYIVNFPTCRILPLAHNKLCALKRQPTWLFERLLNFNEGQFVMEHAAKWLTT